MMETLFWSVMLLLAYTYVGYPAALWIVTRVYARRNHVSEFTPPITIVIVVYNEEARIVKKLENCLSLDYPGELLNIIVVSDGSDDDTSTLVQSYAAQRIRLLESPQRRGKAACINDAIQSCQSEYIVLTDVRQRLDPGALRALLRNFKDENVGAVSGELVFEVGDGSGFEKGVDAYWRYEKFIRNCEGAIDSVVGVTGAIYAIRKSYFQPIPHGTILDDVLIPMNVVLQGKRVIFEPGALAFDLPEKDLAGESRRKRRTLAGNYQLLALRPAILNPFRNRIWIQFVSHKLTRLLAPLTMVTAFTTNLLLAGTSVFYTTIFIAQFALYLLALAGIWWPRSQRHVAVRIPATFFAFNWYAVLGFIEFIRNRRRGGHLWR